MARALNHALSALFIKSNMTETKLIEICPRCGLFGLADRVCEYCGYDAVEAYVEARLERERKESK